MSFPPAAPMDSWTPRELSKCHPRWLLQEETEWPAADEIR
jgi:hypothetical protein